nr:MAG: RNA-dependent RNA polymerase [Riboviria sp.]
MQEPPPDMRHLVKMPHNMPSPDECENQRQYHQLMIPGMWNVGIHTDCVHNELKAVVGRVLSMVPKPVPMAINALRSLTISMAKSLPCSSPIPLEEVALCFPANKRKLYKQVVQSLSESGLTMRDVRVTAFVKQEKLQDTSKDPRMIQYRSPRFNVMLARFTRPLESTLYGLRDVDGQRMVAKGMNMRKRALTLRRMWLTFLDPVALSLDLSRWDMHCNVSLIKIMHLFYLTMIPDKEFKGLLSHQLLNIVLTKGGLRYKVQGNVMSGDMTTALGNCVLIIIIQLTLRKLTGIHFKILDDGDDHVVLVERHEAQLLMSKMELWFKSLGLSLRVDGQTDEFQNIVFCQHKPIYHHGVWEMMPDPRKVLATAFTVTGKRDVQVYLREVWGMRALLHQGQPILGPIFRNLTLKYPPIAHNRGTQYVGLDRLTKADGRSTIEIHDVELEARQQVYVMWGFEPDDQVRLESMQIETFPT